MAINPTIPNIIDIAKVSRILADKANAEGALFEQPVSPILPIQLWVLTKDVEDIYELNPNYDGLEEVALFLFGLCNPTAANLITGGGSAIIPGGGGSGSRVPAFIMITGAMFASALSWEGQNSENVDILSSYSLLIFWNNFNRPLTEGYEYTRTLTGFDVINNDVTISGFDALTTNATDIFYVFISI